MQVTYTIIGEHEWDTLPVPQHVAQALERARRWNDVFDLLAAGRIVSVPYGSRSERRGLLGAVGRGAAKRSLKLQRRDDGERVAFRRADG